jgi:hypothetical protein
MQQIVVAEQNFVGFEGAEWQGWQGEAHPFMLPIEKNITWAQDKNEKDIQSPLHGDMSPTYH